MFNGIIFNKGLVANISKRSKGINIFVKSDLKLNINDIGVSVSCDGVCLTLITIKKKGITLVKSSLNNNGLFDLKMILRKSFTLGVRNLLIEGGDKVTKNLIKNRLINIFYLFQSPKKLLKNNINQSFTSFDILNKKYKKKIKVGSKLAKDNITIYKR